MDGVEKKKTKKSFLKVSSETLNLISSKLTCRNCGREVGREGGLLRRERPWYNNWGFALRIYIGSVHLKSFTVFLSFSSKIRRTDANPIRPTQLSMYVPPHRPS